MARYSLEVKASARKELDALGDVLFTRIDRKIMALAENPRPAGCKKLRGYKDLWRIRIGDYRVIYFINEGKQFISIARVAHRKEVYEL